MNLKYVARDTFIIFALTMIGYFIVGVNGLEDRDAASISFYFLFMIIGFIISGATIRNKRFQHLFKVAIGVWLLNLIDVAFFGLTIFDWGFSLILILILMGIGGLLSFVFTKIPAGEARDTIIVLSLPFLYGIVIGVFDTTITEISLGLIISNTLLLIIGFTICGAGAKTNRFERLFNVTRNVWLINFALAAGFFEDLLGNDWVTYREQLFGTVGPLAWLVGFIFMLMLMGIGGLLSFVFAKTPKVEQVISKPVS